MIITKLCRRQNKITKVFRKMEFFTALWYGTVGSLFPVGGKLVWYHGMKELGPGGGSL